MKQDPQFIIDMIDNEGWPDALGWLQDCDFDDDELRELLSEALEVYSNLSLLEKHILDRAEELGADVYIR